MTLLMKWTYHTTELHIINVSMRFFKAFSGTMSYASLTCQRYILDFWVNHGLSGKYPFFVLQPVIVYISD